MPDISRAKSAFFDRAAVMAAVDPATRAALSRMGAFVRTRAKSSIRKRKKGSAPGSPPSSHTGQLRKLVFFAYDPAARSAVVGPLKWGKGEAPAVLERGGRDSEGRVYRPRPYMAPALEAERPNFAAAFRDSIKGRG